MEWNFRNGLPIYSQIMDELTMRISSGAYKPGERLPSVRELATEAGVNPNTMQRAMTELERRNLVYTERTSGRFVTQDEEILKGLHENLSVKYILELDEKLQKIGMTHEEIVDMVNKWLDARKKGNEQLLQTQEK